MQTEQHVLLLPAIEFKMITSAMIIQMCIATLLSAKLAKLAVAKTGTPVSHGGASVAPPGA
jgi:hypothetical protein